ncbi:MAG: hypothetical protein ACM31L_18985 [Actinomycetota bacterium]
MRAAEDAMHGQTIGAAQMEKIISGLKQSPSFDEFYRRAYREMMEIVENEKLELKRTNAFGRLMVHPLTVLFEAGIFERDILPNIFSFIHLVLGDEGDVYGEHCQDIVQSLKDEMGDEFNWDAFYGDGRAKVIYWHTLVRIAHSFKRWELRKDWFIKLMQYTPTTVSLSSNAFVTREHDPNEEPRVFGEREFCQFFQALFAPLQDLSGDDEALFRQEFGNDPHHLIGPFLVNLTTCPID